MRNMFGSCGCVLLAGTLAIALSSPVAAQSSTDDNWNKYSVGIFGGGQFWRLTGPNNTNGKLTAGVAAGVRADQDFSQHFGIEESWTAYGRNNLRLMPLQPYPDQVVGLGAHNGQVYVGPLLYLAPPSNNIRPYVTVGPAFEYFYPTFDATLQVHNTLAYNTLTLNTKYGPALGFGAGVKFAVGEHWDIRLDVRGTYTSNPDWGLTAAPQGPGALYIQQGVQQVGVVASLGLDRAWGKHAAPPAPPPPPPPPVAINVSSVTADQATVCSGVTVHVTVVSDAPANATYRWTVNGDPAGEDKTLAFDTTNKSAGTYNIAVTVSAPTHLDGKGGTTVTVQAYVAPTGTLTANPSEVWVGDKSELAVGNLSNQCGGPVRVTGYSASEGTVSGTTYDSTGVQFDATNRGEQRKPVTVTANLKDDRGEGTATTTVTVKKKAAPRPVAQLSDLIFARNNARVNNCDKRVLLEELKTYRDADPNGKVLLIGHVDKGELKKMHLDEKRAMNAAAVITAATGVCSNFNPSQVLIKWQGEEQSAEYKAHFCEASVRERASGRISPNDKRAQYRRVEVWWIPSDAEMPANAADAKDAASLGVSKLGCPK